MPKENKTMKENASDKLNEAFDLHKDSFAAGLHDTLWQILMNRVFAGKVVAFTHSYREEGHQLGVAVANEPGFCPTTGYFKEGLNYNAASAIADSLNEIVFGLNEKAAARVVASSMAAQRLRGLTTAATIARADFAEFEIAIVQHSPHGDNPSVKGHRMDYWIDEPHGDSPSLGGAALHRAWCQSLSSRRVYGRSQSG